ncbi:MAG: xylulokinase [Anaerolineae bacterium]
MLLGIDLGTSSLRAAVVDEHGCILGLGQQEYGIDVPRPGWAEQYVNAWWEGAVRAVRQSLQQARITPTAIHGIGLSGQMHGTVLVDVEGCAIAPAIIWADTRSSKEAQSINEALGAERLVAVAGNRASPGFMAATLAWLGEHEPGLLERARYALLPKDYLRLRLTGEAATEPSDASASLLFDITKWQWSQTLIEAVGVDSRLLPPLVPSTAVTGGLQAVVAEELGLLPGTPVVAGAGDQAAQAVGNGVIEENEASSTIGTGGQVFQPCRCPTADPLLRVHCFCHALPHTWYLMGAMLAAGLSLRWWRDTLGLTGSEAYSTLDGEAQAVPPGAGGLLFLPYLLGERTPHMDPAARGAFIGLALHHGRGHLARAIMEGVAFALCDGLAVLSELAPRPRRVVASGGGAKSRLWLQIQADVFGLPMATVAGIERAVVGAAMLAGIGTGIFDGFEQARESCVVYDDVIKPDKDRAKLYQAMFEQYRSLYPALREHLHALSESAH